MPSKAASNREDRALLTVSVVGGAAAVATYPLSIAYPQALALVFVVPLVLATAGRLRGLKFLEATSIALTAVLVVSFVVSVAFPVVLTMTLGPVVLLYLVGAELLRRDRLAAGAWLASTSVGLIAGFLVMGVSPGGGAVVSVGVVTLGAVAALMRLRAGRPAAR